MTQSLIALCESGVKVKNAPLENITTSNLFSLIKNVKVGNKDGSYFLRTTIDDPSKGRSDANATSTASILVLDADSTVDTATGETIEGAPCPHAVHTALKTAGINHLICSTHSHHQKGNRYRILFGTDKPYTKAELQPTVSHALCLCGGELADVTENCTWAQPWYIPRKPQPDSEVIQLTYTDGQPLPVQAPAPDFTTYKPQQAPKQGLSPVDAYNQQTTIEAELEARGDTKHGTRWLYAHSASKEAGISVHDNKMFSHHDSDPLSDGKAHDCFDVMQSRLGMNYNDAIQYAAKHTQAPNGQTVDTFNKSEYAHTTQTTPPRIVFKPLQVFKEVELLPVLPVPFNALPAPLEAWCNDVASRIGCAPDYLVVGVLTVLSSLLGRKVLIKPKQKHDWEVTPNLFGAIIGRPSTKKSPALSESLYYINRMDKQARLENAQALKRYKAEVKLLKIQEKETERKAKLEAKADKESALRMLEELAAGLEKPPVIRFTVHDATVEKLAVLLADNHNGLLTIRDEIAGLLSDLDREENATARGFYLQMFNGNQEYSYDRITRDSVTIPACIGSILGGIQPAKLQRYLMPTASGNNDDGLLQRIQLIAYPDAVVGTGKDEYPDKQAKEKLTAMFDYFASLPDKTQPLNFDKSAQGIFYDWEKENTRKASKEKNPAMEAHLSKYPAFVASLALIIHLADNQKLTPVSDASLLKAIGLAEYYESQSRRVYGMAEISENTARSLVDNLHKLNNPFTASDFRNKKWGGLTTASGRSEALAILVSRGYLSERKTTVLNNNQSKTIYYKNELLGE